MSDSKYVILFRPVGQHELELIQQSHNRNFPPRLPQQPFFYPVLTEQYAIQIARDRNAKYNEPKCGYVTRFRVRKEFIDRYPAKTVGGAEHQEFGYRPMNLMSSIGILSVKLK